MKVKYRIRLILETQFGDSPWHMEKEFSTVELSDIKSPLIFAQQISDILVVLCTRIIDLVRHFATN